MKISQETYAYSILEKAKVSLSLKNKYNIHPNDLFLLAGRDNKKRSFLFVSKVLGKHIPVIPAVSLLAGRALGLLYNNGNETNDTIIRIFDVLKGKVDASEFYDEIKNERVELKQQTLIIGFAETATALGHSVFDSFKNNCAYIHTTREPIEGKSCFEFEEVHSHATSHKVFPNNFTLLKSDCPIVFVDDEITTGNTVLNFIEEIHRKYPREKYTVVSILDWRTESHKLKYQAFEKKLGINIEHISLLEGELDVVETSKPIELEKLINRGNTMPNDYNEEIVYLDEFFSETIINNGNSYIEKSGRFGLNASENIELDNIIEQAADYLRKIKKGKRILCLGTTEFMYIPMKIAAKLGKDIVYHSTTRSPVYPNDKIDYGVKNGLCFDSPNEENIINYLYNIPNDGYDQVFIFFEKKYDEQNMHYLISKLEQKGLKNIVVVICTR